MFSERISEGYFHDAILQKFRTLSIVVLRGAWDAATSLPSHGSQEQPQLQSPISNLPVELLLETIQFCDICRLWHLAVALGRPQWYRECMRRRVRSVLRSFFVRIDGFHRCMEESGTFIFGNTVTGMILPGEWSEHKLKLTVSYANWERLRQFVVSEGYEEVVDDEDALGTFDGFEMVYGKDDRRVVLFVYDPSHGGTVLDIIMNTPLTVSMCYLTPRGVVVLYPELTLSSQTAVRADAFEDQVKPVEGLYHNMQDKIAFFQIGNVIITTNYLTTMSRRARVCQVGT